MIYSTHGWLHLSVGRADRMLYWGGISLAVTTGLLAAGAFFGTDGVAAGYALSFFVLFIPAFSYAGWPINLTAGAVLRATWKYAAAAALSYGSCRLTLPYLPGYETAGLFLRCALSGTACTFVYGGGVALLFGTIAPLSEFLRFGMRMARLSTPRRAGSLI